MEIWTEGWPQKWVASTNGACAERMFSAYWSLDACAWESARRQQALEAAHHSVRCRSFCGSVGLWECGCGGVETVPFFLSLVCSFNLWTCSFDLKLFRTICQVCACVCVCVLCTQELCKDCEQLTEAVSFHLPCGYQGSNTGHQSWKQVSLCTKPSC